MISRASVLIFCTAIFLALAAQDLDAAKKTPKTSATQSAKKKKKSAEDEEAEAPVAPQKPVRPPRTSGEVPSANGVPDVSQLSSELPILARGACVIDEWTGETLYAKNADQPFFPASTTKILTALLVIEEGDLDHVVTVGDEEPRIGESSLDLQTGELFTRRQLLYGLMLKSANDVAHALARDNAGSIEAFAEKMNRRARELGATNSHFVNPHGLHNPQHYTTPHDLGLIARAAMRQPLFREIVSTENFSWQSPSHGLQLLTNHDRLLRMFPGCTGIKTGYTGPAGNVFVGAALWSTREVISVVMHTDRPGQWADSKLLLTYGFAHLPELVLQ